MAYEAFCITYRLNRWAVTHRGRNLGSFMFRAKALQAAIEAAHWTARESHRPIIYIHDSTGHFYTAWRGDTDSICITA
jgi:hypothetical protein